MRAKSFVLLEAMFRNLEGGHEGVLRNVIGLKDNQH